MKRNKNYIYPQAYYALKLNEFSMDVHSHDRLEIMYVVKGMCTVEVDGELLSLQAHQFILINENIPHKLIVNNGEPNILLNLEFGFLGEDIGTDFSLLLQKKESMKKLISSFRYFLSKEARKLEYALKDLIEELENVHRDTYLLDILLQRMLIELVHCLDAKKSVSGLSHVKKAAAFIQEHYSEDISVPVIADFVGINKSYLQVLFQKTFGCGIMAYVNHCRLEHATFLLKNSRLSITEIAFEVGYNSRQHFGYTFANQYNTSPKEYRTLNQKITNADTGHFRNI